MVTHSSRGSPQSMVSVACGPVMASTTVCQRLSSSPTSLKLSRLRPPIPGDVARKWRRFSETRNPSNSESDSSSTIEKMYSFLWKQRKEEQVRPDQTRPGSIRLYWFTFCLSLGILMVATNENSAGKKSQLVKIWEAGKLSAVATAPANRSPLDPLD